MKDISEGAEADERQFLSQSNLGCHDNVHLQVNQDGQLGHDGHDGHWTRNLAACSDARMRASHFWRLCQSLEYKILQVKSPCCNFSQWFQADTIVSPGELEMGEDCKGCGVQPQKGGQAISINVGWR